MSPTTGGTLSDEIGHYRIRQKLGSGGMGDVYLADDVKLRRPVALKVLPPDVAQNAERRTRFLQEAHAASVLSHPNVSTIFEVGEDGDTIFIAMEYIQGETLAQMRARRTPAVDEILDIAIQASDALDEAHAAGIIHRDIKSANLMITSRGHVKVLDFGLAKLRTPDGDAGEEDTKIKTTPGLVIGTPYFMSPEQALGRTVDPRSDLFSLGVVLYELVTGRLPFVGATTTETIEKITHLEPDPMARFNYALPQELERIIRKLLEKDPSRRYQSARDLLVDLKNLKRDTSSGEVVTNRASAPPRGHRTTIIAAALAAVIGLAVAVAVLRPWQRSGIAGASTIESIAVLPFVNAGASGESEYLSDGISESIINDLSRISDLRVIPRGTVFRYKAREIDVIKVADELNVRAIVTGRVQQRGDRIMVQAELVDAQSNSQLWGARYDRKVGDALALQEEISKQIALRLRSSSEGPNSNSRAMTRDPDAYQLYLKGRYHWNKRTGVSIAKALEYFQQTVSRDPGFALAHVGVADCHLVLEQYGDQPGEEMTARAEEAVKKALAIDPQSAEAYASLGFVHSNRWEWAESEGAYRRSIELNPRYATARHWYNIYLRSAGRVDEALVQVLKAQELDPLSMIIGTNVVDVLVLLGRTDEALRMAEKYLEIDAGFPQMLGLVSTAEGLRGRHDAAIAAARKAVENSGETTEQLANLATAYAVAGNREAAMALVRRLEARVAARKGDAYFLAAPYCVLDQRDKAFAALNESVERRSGVVSGLKAEVRLRPLHDDPRFKAVVRRLGLPV